MAAAALAAAVAAAAVAVAAAAARSPYRCVWEVELVQVTLTHARKLPRTGWSGATPHASCTRSPPSLCLSAHRCPLLPRAPVPVGRACLGSSCACRYCALLALACLVPVASGSICTPELPSLLSLPCRPRLVAKLLVSQMLLLAHALVSLVPLHTQPTWWPTPLRCARRTCPRCTWCRTMYQILTSHGASIRLSAAEGGGGAPEAQAWLCAGMLAACLLPTVRAKGRLWVCGWAYLQAPRDLHTCAQQPNKTAGPRRFASRVLICSPFLLAMSPQVLPGSGRLCAPKPWRGLGAPTC